MIKINSDKTAAVNTDVPWIPVGLYPPPTGVKLQLINRNAGVAIYGQYRSSDFWTHWQALPKFMD